MRRNERRRSFIEWLDTHDTGARGMAAGIRAKVLFASAMIGLGIESAHATCGLAFCMVNTNWNLQGLAAEPGLRLDLRYEFVDQDQPLSGKRKVGVGEVSRHHDEVRTVNRNLVTDSQGRFVDH